jgi:hypothetical protein
MYSSKR